MGLVVDHGATVIEIADVTRFHCDVMKVDTSTRLEVAICRRQESDTRSALLERDQGALVYRHLMSGVPQQTSGCKAADRPPYDGDFHGLNPKSVARIRANDTQAKPVRDSEILRASCLLQSNLVNNRRPGLCNAANVYSRVNWGKQHGNQTGKIP